MPPPLRTARHPVIDGDQHTLILVSHPKGDLDIRSAVLHGVADHQVGEYLGEEAVGPDLPGGLVVSDDSIGKMFDLPANYPIEVYFGLRSENVRWIRRMVETVPRISILFWTLRCSFSVLRMSCVRMSR